MDAGRPVEPERPGLIADRRRWEAAAALKAAGGEVAKIPLVAVTALEPDPDSIRSAGFCAVLTKPSRRSR